MRYALLLAMVVACKPSSPIEPRPTEKTCKKRYARCIVRGPHPGYWLGRPPETAAEFEARCNTAFALCMKVAKLLEDHDERHP